MESKVWQCFEISFSVMGENCNKLHSLRENFTAFSTASELKLQSFEVFNGMGKQRKFSETTNKRSWLFDDRNKAGGRNLAMLMVS